MASAAFKEFPETEGPEPVAPMVFVRTIAVPAGLPWDQARAAQLEARHGAPLPIPEVMHRLRRLETWGPGRPGRYAVFYVRRRDYTGPFETVEEVDGQSVRVAFGGGARTSSDTLPRLQRLVFLGLGAIALLLAVGYATGEVINTRNQAAQRLDLLEHNVAAKLRAGRRLEADHLRLLALTQSHPDAAIPQEVVDDIAWVAQAKAPDARIVALHWDRGLIAIEARGDTPPLTSGDRPITRGPHPRPGLTLWGVGRPQLPLATQRSENRR
ncbi:hypothetical protein [Phenylobacterium sp.]|uniref:hypothetical protein n=1 Tax=Phenylobacterium sp. TaxID=1871053 RepID=UPI002C51E163|nr:hypothetical protein [Phenylobacterium sp.]HLZ77173.1 hypothetical protein [Phenylobacterium sp.]